MGLFCVQLAGAQTSEHSESPGKEWPGIGFVERDELPEIDDFDLWGRSSTTIELFQRTRTFVPEQVGRQPSTHAPVHQSLSAHVSRVDSPLGEDTFSASVAAWGQLNFGATEGTKAADWDLPSAFVTQRIGALDLSLGRQVAAGGAARYMRMDGARLRARLPFGANITGYGGLRALPRWSDRYGYHSLGSAYEDWAESPTAHPEPQRSQNGMGGVEIDYGSAKGDRLGLSYHHQSEQGSPEDNLALDAVLSRVENFQFRGSFDYSIAQERFSELRLSGDWDAWVDSQGVPRATLHARVLHTLPSLLLSQASVFSVFAYQEITEAGGELSTQLPARIRVGAGAYGQIYSEGEPGLRAHLKFRFALDDKESLVLRAVATRLSGVDNGYWMARAAASYHFVRDFKAVLDMHQYFYDEDITGVSFSSHYAVHLGYQPETQYWARIGASVARTPAAQVDARVLAQLTIDWERRARK